VLQEYHAALSEALEGLGYSQKLISVEELQAEYDSKAMLGVIYACALLPLVLLDPHSEWDFDASLQDDAPPTAVTYSQTYKMALKRMLHMFEKQGVFRQM
jgi:hypothetical protein